MSAEKNEHVDAVIMGMRVRLAGVSLSCARLSTRALTFTLCTIRASLFSRHGSHSRHGRMVIHLKKQNETWYSCYRYYQILNAPELHPCSSTQFLYQAPTMPAIGMSMPVVYVAPSDSRYT